jgi:hypothetical protein
MTWIARYLQYPEVVAFLRKVEQGHDQTFADVHAYLSGVRDRIGDLIQESKKGPFAVRADPTRGSDAVSSPTFDAPVSKFIGAPDCAFAPYKVAHRNFAKVLAQLATLRDEFRGKIGTICKNMKADLDVLSDARAHFDAAYQAYQQAAVDLTAAADRRAPNLGELKAQFIAAQRTAVDLHTHMNEMIAQTAMKMEGGLTAYEEAERWKSEQIQAFLTGVAEWCELFSAEVDKSSGQFARLKQAIPSDEALMTMMDGTRFPDPRSCDEFQINRLDPAVMHFVDGAVLFPNAAKERLPLFRVAGACPGGRDRLPVSQGDIICQIEDRGDTILAMNINNVKGIVPRSALAPLG